MISIDMIGKPPEQVYAALRDTSEEASDFAALLREHIPVDQSTGDIALDLVRLTLLLETVAGASQRGGGLGGSYGYGCSFENTVFGMHPYCWCDRDDCQWCMGCTCVEEYLHDGQIVTCDTWWEDREQWHKDQSEEPRWDVDVPGYSSRTVTYCSHHRPDNPVEEAPNFWHKSSGIHISWYKYIGRGMEINIPEGARWDQVYTETIRSITALPFSFAPVWPTPVAETGLSND